MTAKITPITGKTPTPIKKDATMTTKKPAAKTPTPIKQETPAVIEPAVTPEPIVTPEPTAPPEEPPVVKKPKLSYAQKLALLPPEEAAVIRAKANEASKKSRAKKLGLNPEDLKVQRLEKAVEKAKAKLIEATDAYDLALAALKQEMETSDAEAK